MGDEAETFNLPKEIKFLLRHLTDWLVLMRQSKLLSVPEITKRLRPFLDDNPENRVLLLQELIDEIIGSELAAARGKTNQRRTGEWEALQLRFVENLSEAEVAAKLGVAPATVRRYVRTGTILLCQEFNRRFLSGGRGASRRKSARDST